MDKHLEKLRIDKWLWAARFYKTRALATEAVSGGKVHLNGERCKAGRSIKVGDCLTISRGYQEMEVIIQDLNKQRRPASEAAQLYLETEQSIKQRQAKAEMMKQNMPTFQRDKRPNKKDRRQIIRFQRKQ
ncbi:MAG: S4 domain-containing protein [Gammaproteobacteria bacterium]|nr:S4 domain-containing protein [Gammaproteobacteria bacterium]